MPTVIAHAIVGSSLSLLPTEVPVMRLAVTLALPAVMSRRLQRFSKPWWTVVALCFVATVSHGVLDAFTDAGLGGGFFIPLENTRYFFPWRPIETSPLSVAAFVNGPGLRILANELTWIGLPLAGLIAALSIIRFIRRGSSG